MAYVISGYWSPGYAVGDQTGDATAPGSMIYGGGWIIPGNASNGAYANAPSGFGPNVVKANQHRASSIDQSRPSQSSTSRPSVKSGGRL